MVLIEYSYVIAFILHDVFILKIDIFGFWK